MRENAHRPHGPQLQKAPSPFSTARRFRDHYVCTQDEKKQVKLLRLHVMNLINLRKFSRDVGSLETARVGGGGESFWRWCGVDLGLGGVGGWRQTWRSAMHDELDNLLLSDMQRRGGKGVLEVVALFFFLPRITAFFGDMLILLVEGSSKDSVTPLQNLKNCSGTQRRPS